VNRFDLTTLVLSVFGFFLIGWVVLATVMYIFDLGKKSGSKKGRQELRARGSQFSSDLKSPELQRNLRYEFRWLIRFFGFLFACLILSSFL